MSLRIVAMAAALVGGVSWVANMFIDLAPLLWAGYALLGVALAAVGSSLVRQLWLKTIAAVGTVGLTGSVVELARDATDDRLLEGVLGGVATLLVALSLLHRPRRH